MVDEYVTMLKKGGDKLPLTDKSEEYYQVILNLQGQISALNKLLIHQEYNNNNNNLPNSSADLDVKQYIELLLKQF